MVKNTKITITAKTTNNTYIKNNKIKHLTQNIC